MTGYLAPKDYLPELLKELNGLTHVEQVHGRLVLTSQKPVHSVWAQNVWLNPRTVQIESISEAAHSLRAMQRNWALYSIKSHRRAQLIAEKLPTISMKLLEFPSPLPNAPMGSWALLDHQLLIASTKCSSPFPNGEMYFNENKEQPPSRAYLKLWEGLTLAGRQPGPGDRCLDMGSSPGGWTWVLHELGAHVISVDKALLDSKIASLSRVQTLHQDAFTLDPHDVGPVDWFFSDIICYPQKLFDLVEKWIKAGTCKRFICTLKFQGKEISPSDHEAIQAFAAIPGSTVRHLFHNKHELTWMKL